MALLKACGLSSGAKYLQRLRDLHFWVSWLFLAIVQKEGALGANDLARAMCQRLIPAPSAAA